MPAEDEIDLIELARTIWRGKLVIALAMIAAGAVAYAYLTFIAVPFYTAQAVVALENRQETVVSLDSVMSGLSGDQATINTEVEVLRSRNLVGQLVDEMALLEDPEFNPFLTSDQPTPSAQIAQDAAIDAVLDAIRIANVRSSYVYTITAVTTSAEKSQKMADTLAGLYIRDQLTVKFEATAQASSWLTERVTTLKADLEQAESEVQAFSASTTLISPEALEAINRQIKDSRDRLATLGQTRETLAARVAALEAALASGDRAQMLAAAEEPALERLADAPQATFAAQYRAVMERAQVDLTRAEAQVISLGASIQRQEADFDRQSRDLVALEQLQREALATRTIYEYFLTRLKETSVQEGIQQADARILSYAALPSAPTQPRKVRAMALALTLGLIVGSGIVFLREMLHSGFRNGEQLEQATGITVMGQVPLIPARKRKGVIEYLVEMPTSAAAEAIRNLRTSLLLSNIDNPPKVILSTSSVPGEGKTTTAIALAQNFTGLGKSVLLIEGDIRRKVFSEYFDLDESRGLLAVLAGEAQFEDVVQPLALIGADVLIGERSTTNAADVFSSDRFKQFMVEMRARYDIVIIDTPPVLLVPDARIIAHEVDAVLFTVKWDHTTRAQVREAVRQFATVGRPITGLVLGQIDPKGMKRYGYGNSYGAYANYGSKYYNS
ncbi:MAG: chain-length determining protein [Rhodobacterales bacterium CG2_30_65_12]|nr:MAG: chain-length determining protein [Rhodobacterales bacterium CG2_30_65_12]